MSESAKPARAEGAAPADRTKIFVGAAACIALGVFAVLAGQRMFATPEPVVRNGGPAPSAPIVKHPELGDPQAVPEPAPTAEPSNAGTQPESSPPTEPAPTPTPAAKPASELTGTVGPGAGGSPNVPVNPVVIGDPNAPPKAAFAEISIGAAGDDVDSMIARVESIAASSKGYAWAYRLPRYSETPEARAVVVVVPAAEIGAVVKKLAGLDGATVLEESSGDVDERNARLERPLRTRLSELEKNRQKLLLKFLDDAPAVVEVGEKIASLKAQLGGFKRVPPDRAAIRIVFGSG